MSTMGIAEKKIRKKPSKKIDDKTETVDKDPSDDEATALPEVEVEAAGAAAAAESEKQLKASKKASKSRRLENMEAKQSKEPKIPRGVVYLGHLPPGFFEPQMKKFFSQFGNLTRWKLSRSFKKGASRGYGWVEFEDEGVAKIVAQTMDKYLLFERQLVCKLLPPEQVHRSIFKNWKRPKKDMTMKLLENERERHNDRPTVSVSGEEVPQTTIGQAKRRRAREDKLKTLLKDLDVEYDFDFGSSPQQTSGGPPGGLGKKSTTAVEKGSSTDEPKKKKRKQEGAKDNAVGNTAATKEGGEGATAKGAPVAEATGEPKRTTKGKVRKKAAS